jgi:hypothetical protein
MVMPIAMRTFMKPEKMFGRMHGHQLDWDESIDGRHNAQPKTRLASC